MGLDQDLALLLGFGGKVKPPLHGLAPATAEIPEAQTEGGGWGVGASLPLCVQPHQLVHVEAETNVGDGAAGVGLAVGGQEGEVSAGTDTF